MAAIAIRSGRYDVHKETIRLASNHGIMMDEIPIVPRQERDFGDLLFGSLDGITTVLSQHRLGGYCVDFYLPALSLVVEFDERHHKSPAHAARDAARQGEIEIAHGVSFIRVEHGREVYGLNEVLKAIFSGR